MLDLENKKIKNLGGYIALTSVIILTGILVLIFSGITALSVGEMERTIDMELSQKARSLSHECIEHGLNELRKNPDYSGDEILGGEDKFCVIEEVYQDGISRSFVVMGEYYDYNFEKHIEAEILEEEGERWINLVYYGEDSSIESGDGGGDENGEEPDFSCGGDFEYEGYDYSTVETGDQCWFAEDLRHDDGCTQNEWNDDSPYNACDYADPAEECNFCSDPVDYGHILYQWEAAKQVCPSGWRLASDEDWKDLEAWLGMPEGELDETGYRGADEGDRLKDPDEDWCDSETCGGTGFLGLPGGYRNLDGDLYQVGSANAWWTSTESNSDGLQRYLDSSESGIGRNDRLQSFGYSVRCIME